MRPTNRARSVKERQPIALTECQREAIQRAVSASEHFGAAGAFPSLAPALKPLQRARYRALLRLGG
jgi:hypothetical protein